MKTCKDCKTKPTHLSLPRCKECNSTFRKSKGYDLRKNRRKAEEAIEKEVESETSKQYVQNKNYYYNESEDMYIIFAKGKTKNLIIPGDTIREMKKQYSSLSPGGYENINQICLAHTISRKDFLTIRNVMGWTHTDDPYTDEEMMSEDPSALAEDLLQARRYDFERQFRKEDWKQTEKDASLWRRFAHEFGLKDKDVKTLIEDFKKINSVKNYIDTVNLPEIKKVKANKSKRKTLIIPLSDIHFGKVYKGDLNHGEINVNVLEKRKETIKQFIINNKGDYDNVIYLSMGDTFEALLGNMREGQASGMDLHGFDQYKLGVQFHSEIIKTIKQAYPKQNIDCYFIPGNHDRVTKNKEFNSEDLMNAIMTERLGVEFKSDKRIKMFVSEWVQPIRINKDVLLIAQHGHQSKIKDDDKGLASFVYTHGDRMTKRHIIIEGHYHHFKSKAIRDILYITNPSVCGADEYSVQKLNLTSEPAFIMISVDDKNEHIIGPFRLNE